MKVSFYPKTKPGIWSLILFILLILLVVYFLLMISVFNQRGGQTFFSNLNLAIPMIVAWVSGLLSFILGLIAVFRMKSRAVLVFIVIALSFLTTIYGIAMVL